MNIQPKQTNEQTDIGVAIGTIGATLGFMLSKIRELENRVEVLERCIPYDPYPNKGATERPNAELTGRPLADGPGSAQG